MSMSRYMYIGVVVLMIIVISGCGRPGTEEKFVQIAQWEDQATLHNGDLLAYLTDSDVEVRRRAALAAGRVGDTLAGDALIGALADPDTVVRANAAVSIGFIKFKEGKSGLLKHLQQENNGFVLGYMVWAMGRLYAQEYGDSLMPYLLHDDVRVRRQIPITMFMLSHKPAGDAVAARLDDPDPIVRRNALFAISRLQPENHASAIVAKLADDDPLIRGLAGLALGYTRDSEYYDDLVKLLDDKNRWARILATHGLGALRDTLKVKELHPYLQTEKDPGVLAQLVEAIGWHWRRESAPYLLKLKNHPDIGVRIKLLSALGRCMKGDAVDELKDFVNDTAWAVRAKLSSQLEFIIKVDRNATEKATELILQLSVDPVPAVRASAIQASMSFGSSMYLPVTAGLYDTDELVQFYAVSMYPFVGGRVPFDTLLQWYKNHQDDPRPDVRMALLALTGNLSPSVQVGAVQRDIFNAGLADPDRLVRQYAVAVWEKFREDHSAEIGIFDSPITDQTYDEYYHEYPAPPRVRFVTAKGEFVVEVYANETPRSAHHFLSLVRSGFYDNTPVGLNDDSRTLHLGDQRGDGWGMCNATLRDEISLRRAERGSLDWLVQHRHDARSVFRINLVPSPDAYMMRTVFGNVVEGMDVVDRLRPMDMIEKVEIISS